MRLSPDAPKPYSQLGTALAYAGRLPEAAAEFESALRLDPNDAVVQSNLGPALSGIPGRLPDALRHLEEADRLSPDPERERAIAHLRAELDRWQRPTPRVASHSNWASRAEDNN